MDLLNLIKKALGAGDYGRGGTTEGRGYQQSANPGPLGAGDIPDPNLYTQTPYMTPTGNWGGIPSDEQYKRGYSASPVELGLGIDPLSLAGRSMDRRLGAEYRMGHLPDDSASVEDIFASYIDQGYSGDEALRSAMVDAARLTAEADARFREAVPSYEKRMVEKKRYGAKE